MKVILLKSVPKLGKINDVLDVPDGYAINALFPKRLATPATPGALATREQKLKNAVTAKALQHDLLDMAVRTLANQTVVYKTKTNDKGSLFSKIDTKDIARELLTTYRVSIDPACMTIRSGQIKNIGSYIVDIAEGGFKSSITIEVQSQ